MTTESPARVIERVDRDLRAMWAAGAAPGEAPRTRACTMNLVVVDGHGAAKQWLPVLDEVVRAVPARSMLVELDPTGKDALQAEATAVCGIGEGRGICSERVHLVAHGEVCARIGSVVEAISISEMPTTVVWLGRAKPADPAFATLAGSAERVVLDSGGGDLGVLAEVVRWASQREGGPAIADLEWTRLSLWQELCARFFDDEPACGAAAGITRLELWQACEPGAPLGASGALLLGWMATRLGWRAERDGAALRVARPDGGAVELLVSALPRPEGVARAALARVRLEATASGVTVRASIERELLSGLEEQEPDKDVLVWNVAVTGAQTASAEQRVRLHGNGGARLLERTLRRPRKDPALVETVRFLEPLGRGAPLSCR
jgi:glucose-6-phosphate dehydrogenase assembly protein OpcA